MFAAVCTTPSWTIASGVAGLGVLILTLSSSNSPDCVSTGAPLIPDPPTSIPNTFMLPPQTDTAVILYDPTLPPEGPVWPTSVGGEPPGIVGWPSTSLGEYCYEANASVSKR